MPCYHPLSARVSKPGVDSRREQIFDRSIAKSSSGFLPCGQCVGCRLERSRQWAMRCLHESSLYDRNCFITLTYDDEHLPSDKSVDVREFQLFMKRLRKANSDVRIRFFHCGEYGEVCKLCGLSRILCKCVQFVVSIGRPHYHACLFNFDPVDRILYSVKNGQRYYVSESLKLIWSNGNVIVGDVTFDSAAYVARYIMKKVTGDFSEAHYDGRRPEYTTMSRRPGIGRGWYDKFKSDVYPHDYAVVNGLKVRPPKFYDSLFEASNPLVMADIKDKRSVGGFKARGELAADRLFVKEFIKKDKVKLLSRSMEVSNDR